MFISFSALFASPSSNCFNVVPLIIVPPIVSFRRLEYKINGGQRLFTYQEKHSTTILKRVEGLHFRFKPEDQLLLPAFILI